MYNNKIVKPTIGCQLHIWYHSLPVYKEFPALVVQFLNSLSLSLSLSHTQSDPITLVPGKAIIKLQKFFVHLIKPTYLSVWLLIIYFKINTGKIPLQRNGMAAIPKITDNSSLIIIWTLLTVCLTPLCNFWHQELHFNSILGTLVFQSITEFKQTSQFYCQSAMLSQQAFQC